MQFADVCVREGAGLGFLGVLRRPAASSSSLQLGQRSRVLRQEPPACPPLLSHQVQVIAASCIEIYFLLHVYSFQLSLQPARTAGFCVRNHLLIHTCTSLKPGCMQEAGLAPRATGRSLWTRAWEPEHLSAFSLAKTCQA